MEGSVCKAGVRIWHLIYRLFHPFLHSPDDLFYLYRFGHVIVHSCFFAFLDINPLVKGHTLVVPKQEVDYIFDLNDEDLAAMHVFAKRVALAIGKAFPCRKVGEAVLGLEVPHAHIHLIPMQNEKDMLFSNPKLKLTDEEFKAVAEAIRAVL